MTRQQAQFDMFPDSPEALRRRADEADRLRANVERILMQVAINVRPCKACGKTLYIVPSIAERIRKHTPYEADGTNHFATCPKAAEFKKP